MSTIRLAISYSNVEVNSKIKLSKEDQNYLFNVLRCQIGKFIEVTNGKGKSFKAKIVDSQHLLITEEEKFSREDIFSIFLCQALLKGQKMELILQKATELGVKEIFPVISRNCVVKKTEKMERWQKIVKEASEQSGRSVIPKIHQLESFDSLIKRVKNGIIFWEKNGKPLNEALKELRIDEPIFLFVGPEGGFTVEEIKIADERGLQIASLGQRILRAETAAIVSVSITNFLLNNYVIIKK